MMQLFKAQIKPATSRPSDYLLLDANQSEQELVTLTWAANLLGVTRDTLLARIKNKSGCFARFPTRINKKEVGKPAFYNKAEVLKFIEHNNYTKKTGKQDSVATTFSVNDFSPLSKIRLDFLRNMQQERA
jgi:hypothetical protein